MNRYTDHYQQQQVLTASPGQLLLLAYDGALRHLRTAAQAMAEKNLSAQSEAVVKTQQIILYLMDTINRDHSPQLAASLEGIYSYLLQQLTEANVKDDKNALELVAGLLQELRNGWAEAEAKLRGEAPALVGVSA